MIKQGELVPKAWGKTMALKIKEFSQTKRSCAKAARKL